VDLELDGASVEKALAAPTAAMSRILSGGGAWMLILIAEGIKY